MNDKRPRTLRTAIVIAGIVVGACLAMAGLGYAAFVGLPLSNAQVHDRRLIDDVAESRDWVSSYYQSFTPNRARWYAFPKALVDAARASGHWGGRLPPTLIEAGRIMGVDRGDALQFLRDPASGAMMTYRRESGSSYELCVAFESSETFESVSSAWSHPAGPHCYTFDAKAGPLDRLPKASNAWFQFCYSSPGDTRPYGTQRA